jgi:hypothetical protein
VRDSLLQKRTLQPLGRLHLDGILATTTSKAGFGSFNEYKGYLRAYVFHVVSALFIEQSFLQGFHEGNARLWERDSCRLTQKSPQTSKTMYATRFFRKGKPYWVYPVYPQFERTGRAMRKAIPKSRICCRRELLFGEPKQPPP